MDTNDHTADTLTDTQELPNPELMAALEAMIQGIEKDGAIALKQQVEEAKSTAAISIRF